MTGIAGGTTTGRSLRRMVDELHQEHWYDREEFEERNLGLGILHHADRDPGGHLTWQGDGQAGVVYGAITNLDTLGYTSSDLFKQLLNDPVSLLPELDGPFVIAAIDGTGERAVIATDKIGSRPCYHWAGQRLRFASEPKSLLPEIDDPIVDRQAVNDLVLVGHMWGDRTLISGIKSIPPASALIYDGESHRIERYWHPNFEEAVPGDNYIHDLVKKYKDSVADVAETIYGSAGLWLSGGLDSRSIASELARNCGQVGNYEDVVGYTYDANPAGAGNPEIAREVAESLDMDIRELTVTPDGFRAVMEDAVALTDGLVRWSNLVNLASVFTLPIDRPSVMLEGAGQGELIGNHLRKYHLDNSISLVESMYDSEAWTDRKTTEAIVDAPVSTFGSFESEARRATADTFENTIKEAHYRNYYSRYQLLSNHMARSQVGTRVPFADGDFLSHTARLPNQYRMGTFPLTKGTIPHGVSEAKLRLMRELSTPLSEIRYERTSVAPSRPMTLHKIGFVSSTALSRLRSEPTYGGATMVDRWYRLNDSLQSYIDDLLLSARDRPFFDGNAIADIQQEHLANEGNHMNVISPVTTVELWLQQFLD